MRRGTTPTNTFDVDIDLRTAEVIYLTYCQPFRSGKDCDECHRCPDYNECFKFEKIKEDMDINEDTVSVKLTQAETLSFDAKKNIAIQFRAKYPGEDAVASNTMITSIENILKEGEI